MTTEVMTTEERVEMLEGAQQQIAEALESIRAATKGTPNEKHTEAYLCAPLSIIVSEGIYRAPYDETIENVIEDLENPDEEDA